MMQSSSKKKQVSYKNDNFLEALKSVPGGVSSAAAQEVSKISGDIVTALLGGTPASSGELAPNQVIEFGARQQEQAPQPAAQIRTEVHRMPDMTVLEQQTKEQITAIREELKALAKSLKTLHQEVQSAISQEPVDPGIYHINFYDQLRSFLEVLRQQLDDSRSWLATFNTRKKKVGYWGMYKKHGTTFGLSSERSIATAAG